MTSSALAILSILGVTLGAVLLSLGEKCFYTRKALGISLVAFGCCFLIIVFLNSSIEEFLTSSEYIRAVGEEISRRTIGN